MSYTVKYKRGLFWKTVKGIVADGFIEEQHNETPNIHTRSDSDTRGSVFYAGLHYLHITFNCVGGN
jgi:hypothetical protein